MPENIIMTCLHKMIFAELPGNVTKRGAILMRKQLTR